MKACQLASEASLEMAALSGAQKAIFLRELAERIEGLVDELVVTMTSETGLPEPRVRGETARTAAQLRMFADLVESGNWVDARIDRAQPDRQPLPKPDLRSMLRPVGPVVVFCASNFPLAFSVAGGFRFSLGGRLSGHRQGPSCPSRHCSVGGQCHRRIRSCERFAGGGVFIDFRIRENGRSILGESPRNQSGGLYRISCRRKSPL